MDWKALNIYYLGLYKESFPTPAVEKKFEGFGSSRLIILTFSSTLNHAPPTKIQIHFLPKIFFFPKNFLKGTGEGKHQHPLITFEALSSRGQNGGRWILKRRGHTVALIQGRQRDTMRIWMF